ncbi:Uncharacterised protein [Vibrio cholerae]|nr:Uncharacterised protein [Vibrio cholerae]CSI17768.1 Uncharacterised protein [Vibrio cholerae]
MSNGESVPTLCINRRIEVDARTQDTVVAGRIHNIE